MLQHDKTKITIVLIINKTTNPNREKSTTDHHTQTRLGQNENQTAYLRMQAHTTSN